MSRSRNLMFFWILQRKASRYNLLYLSLQNNQTIFCSGGNTKESYQEVSKSLQKHGHEGELPGAVPGSLKIYNFFLHCSLGSLAHSEPLFWHPELDILLQRPEVYHQEVQVEGGWCQLLLDLHDQPHRPGHVLHLQRLGCWENLSGFSVLQECCTPPEAECFRLVWISLVNAARIWNRRWTFTRNRYSGIVIQKISFDLYPLSPGKNRGLTLIIDAHSDIASPNTVRDDFEGFLTLVNSQTKFPALFEKVW